MKAYRFSIYFIVMVFAIAQFQCTSMPKLEKNVPVTIVAIYYQKWNSGIKDGGSGINIFIETKDEIVKLDSVYFRGKVTKLHPNLNNRINYVGRFNSSETTSNYKFKLNDDECVLSYIEADKVHYFKIKNLEEHKSLNYPSSPPKHLK